MAVLPEVIMPSIYGRLSMYPNSLLIRHARILLAEGEWLTGDVLVCDERIVEIATSITAKVTREIDATGLVLLPGVIDPQVHFREPGFEHKEDLTTASRACAKGGVTSFLEMPNTQPLTITQAALDDKLDRAAQKSIVNYGFFIGATPANLPDILAANPTCGIKIFMGSGHPGLLIDTAATLEPIFAQGKRLIAVHAEDQARINQRKQEFANSSDPAIHSQIQDDIAALNATKLAVQLSEKYQRRLHILHLSTAIEVEFLRQHKPSWVTAEVTPQHLMLNTDAYTKIGTLAKMNPPLRSHYDNEVLWTGLLDGTIDFIATDHAPHTLEEKTKGHPAPSGMPGVETALPVMLTQAVAGKCTIEQVSNWMSTAVAKAYNIPNKGKIATGYDADLVLVDVENYRLVERKHIVSRCGWNPFEGWNLTGYPVYTIVNGNVVYDQGVIRSEIKGKALSFDAII
jgi:dihydroorotase